jgi:hypothetical protein
MTIDSWWLFLASNVARLRRIPSVMMESQVVYIDVCRFTGLASESLAVHNKNGRLTTVDLAKKGRQRDSERDADDDGGIPTHTTASQRGKHGRKVGAQYIP